MNSDRSIGNVLSDIVGDVQHIVRAEVRLAKVELREEMTKFKRGAILLICGGVVLVIALGFVLLAGVYALATVWPRWAAALVVGGGAALAGLVVALSGKRQMSDVALPPEKTTETIRENFQWAKSRAR